MIICLNLGSQVEKQTGRERGGRAGATDTHHYLRPSLIEFVSAPVVCFLHLVHKPDPSFWRGSRRRRPLRRKVRSPDFASNVNLSRCCLATANTLSSVFPCGQAKQVYQIWRTFSPFFHQFHPLFISLLPPNVDMSYLEVSRQPPPSPHQA